MKLADTQSLFAAGLQPRRSTAQRARARHLVRGNKRIPPELALRIYSNNVSGSLVRALAAAYPASRRILGEQCFNGIARRYIEQSPSDRPDLNHYGATFSEFIDEWTRSQAHFSGYRYLGDLTRLEWLCHTAYYAEDNPPFDFGTLAEAGQEYGESIRLQAGHDVGLMQSDYPVMAIRELNLSDDDAAEVQAGDLPEFLVISRPAYVPRVERVDATTYAILVACRESVTLGHIVKIVSNRTGVVSEKISGLIERGWITGFSIDRKPGAP